MATDVLLILAGALSGGFVLGLTGFGNGLTAYGLWLHVLTPQVSAPLVAVGSIIGHLLMFRGFRHAMSRSRIVPIVVGGLAGVPIGTWLLTVIPTNTFRLFGGLLLAAYSLVTLAGGLRFRIRGENVFGDAIAGWLGGICGGLASLSGPIMTVWCGLKGWSPDEQRAAYQPYNFAMLSAELVGFGVAGFITWELARVAALSLPATLLGVWIGRTCYGRVDAALFRRIVLVLLTISGITLVAQSLI